MHFNFKLLNNIDRKNCGSIINGRHKDIIIGYRIYIYIYIIQATRLAKYMFTKNN